MVLHEVFFVFIIFLNFVSCFRASAVSRFQLLTISKCLAAKALR